MNPKEYILYARSRIYAFLLLLFYGFWSLVLFGCLLDWFPRLNDFIFLFVLLALIFISFCLAQITSRPKIKITLYPDHFETEWQRRILFFRKPDRKVGFELITSYSGSNNFFKIKLNDRSKYELCRKQFILGKANTLLQFSHYFTAANHQWQSARDIPRPAWPTRPVTSNFSAPTNFDQEASSGRSAIFYFSIIFGVIFLGGMGLGLVAVALDEKNIWVALGALAILALTYYLISQYYRCAPLIHCTQTGISFNKKIYSWNDVQTVELTGSQPVNVFGARAMEGAKIEFADGETRYMHDAMYHKLSKIRLFINKTIPGKIAAIEQETSQVPTTALTVPTVATVSYDATGNSETEEYVKGKPYTNFWAIFMWVIVVFLVGIAPFLISDDDDAYGLMILFAFLSLGVIFLFTIHFNYFGLSGQYFIVKNVYRPWKKKMFPLKDIREIVLGNSQQSVDVVRLIFTDFKLKEFGGTGLRNRDWLSLMKLIQAHGIPLKDENSFVLWSTPEMKKSYRKMIFYFILYVILCGGSFLFVLKCHVSATAMIFLKLGCILFSIVAFIGLIRLIVWLGAREDKKKALADEQKSAGGNETMKS